MKDQKIVFSRPGTEETRETGEGKKESLLLAFDNSKRWTGKMCGDTKSTTENLPGEGSIA